MSSKLVRLAAEIVSGYARHNALSREQLTDGLAQVHLALEQVGKPLPAEPAAPTPRISIKKSVTADAITCLECGKQFKAMRRHLRADHGMTPEEYRAKWHLPANYPMTAPNYSARRAELAKSSGLGQKRAAEEVAEPVKKTRRNRSAK